MMLTTLPLLLCAMRLLWSQRIRQRDGPLVLDGLRGRKRVRAWEAVVISAIAVSAQFL